LQWSSVIAVLWLTIRWRVQVFFENTSDFHHQTAWQSSVERVKRKINFLIAMIVKDCQWLSMIADDCFRYFHYQIMHFSLFWYNLLFSSFSKMTIMFYQWINAWLSMIALIAISFFPLAWNSIRTPARTNQLENRNIVLVEKGFFIKSCRTIKISKINFSQAPRPVIFQFSCISIKTTHFILDFFWHKRLNFE